MYGQFGRIIIFGNSYYCNSWEVWGSSIGGTCGLHACNQPNQLHIWCIDRNQFPVSLLFFVLTRWATCMPSSLLQHKGGKTILHCPYPSSRKKSYTDLYYNEQWTITAIFIYKYCSTKYHIVKFLDFSLKKLSILLFLFFSKDFVHVVMLIFCL